MVSRSRRVRVTVVFMVDTDSVLVSSFPSATVDDGYDGSYTRRMARSYGSKWDALRGHVRPGVTVLDFGCGMPENARLLRDLVEGAGGAYYCHDAHPDVEGAMRADGGFRHVSADRLGEYVGAFDVVFMSSVVHEMLTPSCAPGAVENEALFELIGRLVAPSGCIVVRDWADYAVGAQDGSLPAFLDLVDEGAAHEVDQWVNTMAAHGVISDGSARIESRHSGLVLAGERASVCEVFLHAVWGLGSIDRESRERYCSAAFGSPGGFMSRFYGGRGFAVEGVQVFYDEGFARHGSRLFRLDDGLPCATKAVTVLRKGVR